MGNQTTVQNARAIRFGSGMIEVGNDLGSLVNLGAMQNISFEETWTDVNVKSDNAGDVKLGISNHKAAIAGDMMEIELSNLYNIRGGIDKYETISNTPVNGVDQIAGSGNWAYEQFILIEHQNFNGSKITINSVTGSTDGVLTLDTDYYMVKNEKGWGIAIKDSVTVTTTNQSITINHDYTPTAAKILKSGGFTTISTRIVRVTNINEFGQKFMITIFKATNTEGIKINLPADDDDESATTPLKLEGTLDSSRAVGEQLFEIHDEQGVL